MASYVWVGSISSNFGTSTNWSPNGNPGSSDSVSLGTGSNPCTISSPVSIKSLNCATYAGTFTINAALTIGSNGIINPGAAMTFAGSSTATLALSASTTTTITGTARAWGYSLVISAATSASITIAGSSNFIISGDLSFTGSAAVVFNTTTVQNLELKGAFYPGSGGTNGTATILLSGTTTWNGGGAVKNNLTINTAGSVTLGNVAFNTGTFTYTAGTFSHTGTITITGSITWNLSSSIQFDTILINITPITHTINGAILLANVINAPSSITFNGSYGFTTGSYQNSLAGSTVTLKNGNPYTITGTLSIIGTAANNVTFKSSTNGSATYLILSSSVTTVFLLYISATDVDSSGGQSAIQYGGTISGVTKNWITLTTIQSPQEMYNFAL